MPSIHLDTTRLPLAVATFDAHQTLEDLERYIVDFEKLYDRGETFALLVLLKRYNSDRRHLDRMGQWSKESEERARRHCAGMAMITASMGFRFALSTVLLIKPLVMPYKVCATPEEGIDFLRLQLAAKSIQLPSRIDLT